MRDILKQRKDKLSRAYKVNPHIATYARLREVTLLLNKLYQHDKATSPEDTRHAEGGHHAAPPNNTASNGYHGGWRKRQITSQRPWVGLTDEEISASSKGNMTRSGFAQTIEAKLRSKNEGKT